MGKISLSEGFTVIPEGTYVFKIIEVDYKEQFGKLAIKMKTAKGQTHIERFSLLKQDGSTNDGALNAFSYFARVALGDMSATDVDPSELVGCFIECDVEHDTQPSNKNPDRTVTFARLGDKRAAEGYDEEETVLIPNKPEFAPVKKTAGVPGQIDLDSILA